MGNYFSEIFQFGKNVPSPVCITSVIRAGLLQSVGGDEFVNLVASLIHGDNKNVLAHIYIEEVSQHSEQELVDGGFWWDDSQKRKDGSRKSGHRYAPPVCKRKHDLSMDEAERVHQPAADVNEARQLPLCEDPVEHIWDDVVHAIRDDLRVFWGLWATHIGPRLDPGVPLDYETFKEWKADNVDTACVFS